MTQPMNGCGCANGSPTISRSISLRDLVDQLLFLAVLDDQAACRTCSAGPPREMPTGR